MTAKTQSSDSDHKKSFRRSWRSSGPVAKLTVVCAGIVALATVLYAGFAGWQLREIHKGGEDTHRLAEAAQRQANAASEQVNAMRGQLGTMQEQANSMKAQANTLNDSLVETRKSVRAAEKQANASMSQANASQVSAMSAEKSARIAQDSMIATNRPYITFSVASPPTKLQANAPVKVSLAFINEGVSPAEDFSVRAQFLFSPLLRPPTTFIEARNGGFSLINFLIPITIRPHGGTTEITITSGANLSTEDKAAMEDDAALTSNTFRDKQLVLYGEASYTAIGQRFTLKLCLRYTNDGNWAECFNIPVELRKKGKTKKNPN
jgi:hypothetical protein